MSVSSLLKICFLFISISRVAPLQRYPSVAVALSRSGLEFFSSIGHNIVNHELPKIPFPNISFPIKNGPGSGYVSVHGLRIPKFQSPLFKFQLAQPDGITWTTDGGTVKLGGRWKANYTFLTPFYLHGWLTVLAREIRSNVTLGAYGRNGHPQVEVEGCSVDVLDVHLSIGGGVIQWIVNLFKSDLSYALKQTIHDQFCKLMKTVLVERANEELRTLAKHVNILGDLYLDYELERQPVRVTTDSVVGRSYVDVMLGNRTCQLETFPLQIESVDPSYMADIWISESVFNCLLLSAHESTLLHFTLNRDVYSKLNVFLATDCRWYDICIGKFFRELQDEYPDRHVEMKFYSFEAPTITLAENTSANVVAKFFVDLRIQPESGKSNITSVLARIVMSLTATIDPKIFNDRICGTVNSTDVQFAEVFSNIGHLSPYFLTTLHSILNPIIEVVADTSFRLGIPIPLVENISLSARTQVIIIQRAVRINTDLVYKNSTLPANRRQSSSFQFV